MNNPEINVQDVNLPVAAAEQNRDQELVRCLKAVRNGHYDQVPEGTDPVSVALAALIEDLKARALADLNGVVGLSIQSNETGISSAKALMQLREVDVRTQQVAAAAEQMTASVQEIRGGSDAIMASVGQTDAITLRGQKAMQNSIENMGNISETVDTTLSRVKGFTGFTKKISDIAEDIKSIAFQTNLLSLNASVEAARAGEAGAGFNVVANEVRLLSARTSEATKQIEGLVTDLQSQMSDVMGNIENSTKAIDAGQKSVSEAGELMEEIQAGIEQVKLVSRQIDDSLKEQSAASHEVAVGISDIASNTSQNVSEIDQVLNTMDKVEALISERINVLSQLEVPGKILKLAKSDHVIWKRRLANMVSGRQGLNSSELADHHNCRLGKWYDQITDYSYTSQPSFQQLEAPHRRVHQNGLQAVDLYNAGRYREAMAKVAEVEAASVDVLHLLDQLEQELFGTA